ncbi:unnamed protein product [Staurois parvus]|uniref:BING4 C-terminal domain-containing protein n=1 Tax=Staurois parvus TaxID=386267 RepID=A0ABN9HPI2_9NEOB|nr:unnamed protein product [Staurois parvus]
MEFLPYHFMLATCSSTSFLQYLDVSVGKEVSAIFCRSGRLGVMCQNPHNAIIHLGHHNGTVSLWSPSVREPLVKMLCHRGAVRSVSVDKTGMYMATSGLDRKLTIFDLRTYKPLTSFGIPLGAGNLCHSQRGLLAASTGNVVQVYKDTHITEPKTPYMCLSLKAPIHGLQFCPYEDVLGIGHGGGFTSMIIPGAGEANFDGLECNPYESKKQRQEWEVKALLEKVTQLNSKTLILRGPFKVQQCGYTVTPLLLLTCALGSADFRSLKLAECNQMNGSRDREKAMMYRTCILGMDYKHRPRQKEIF